MVKTKLFEEEMLFLELINLSGDYSRKVAENAGFFSYSGNLDCFVAVNPNAESILEKKLSLG